MHKIKLYFLIVCTTLLSCNKNPTVQADRVPAFRLDGIEILKNEIDIKQVVYAGNYLVTKTYSTDFHLKIYDKMSFEPLGSLCRRGSGTGEFPTSLIVDSWEQSGDSTFLWVHDLNESILSKVHIESSLDSIKANVTFRISLPSERQFHQAYYLQKGLVVGRTSNSIPNMSRFIGYDIFKDSVVIDLGLYPSITNKKEYNLNYILQKINPLYVSSIALSPDQKRLASAMHLMDRIDIFNMTGEIDTTYFGSQSQDIRDVEDYLESSSRRFTDLRVYYDDLEWISDKLLITLLNLEGGFLSESYRSRQSKQLFILSADGIAKAAVSISEPITSITYDTQNKTLIGFSGDTNKIYQYEIKEILEQIME
jgi:hypothetical protein